MDQELKGILMQILHRLDGQDTKMDAMEARLNARMDTMDAKWDQKFDMLMSEVAVIKEDITDIRSTMATKDDVNFKVDVLREQTMKHERDILQLKRNQDEWMAIAQL